MRASSVLVLVYPRETNVALALFNLKGVRKLAAQQKMATYSSAIPRNKLR